MVRLCPIKVTYRRFQSPESQFKNFYQFRLTTSQTRLCLEVGFRESANLGKSYSGNWHLSVSHFRDLAILGKSSFGIVGLGRMWWLIFKLTCRGLKIAGKSL
jgi:hypothetical protein